MAASDADLRLIRATGAENDSPSRELARYIAETGRTYHTQVTPMMIFRPDVIAIFEAETIAPSIARGMRRYVSPNIAKTFTISTRMCAWKMVSSMAICFNS